jgi:putative MFS transporter
VRFLGLQGRKDEVGKIFARISSWHKRSISGLTLVIATKEDAEAGSGSAWKRLKQIFAPALLKTTFFLSLVWFSASFCYYGVVFFSPGFFRALSISTYMSIFVTSCGEIVFLIAGGIISKVIGRQRTIGYAYFLCGGSMLLMLMGARVEGFPVWLLLVVSLIARGSASSAFAILQMYTVELYPTPCRTTGYGWCNSASRVAGIVTPFVAIQSDAVLVPIIIYSSVSILTGFTTLWAFKKDTTRLDLED